MTDDPFLSLACADRPRPLPPRLRASLEAALLAGDVAGPDPDGLDLSGVDRPRPLPPRAYARIEAALRGLGGPRPLPAPAYARIEAALLARRRPGGAATAILGAAASVVLLLALVAVAFRGGPGGDLPPAAAPRPTAGASGPAASGTPDPGSSPSPSAQPPSANPTRPPGAGSGGQGGAGGTPPGGPQQYTGPPPPFSEQGRPAPLPQAPGSGGGGGVEQPPPPPPPPADPEPLYVGFHGGTNGPENAGLRAYLDLLNEQGGVHGRPVRLVAPGTRPVVATVNLGNDTVAGRTAARPLIEGIAPPEAALRDDVFSFASAAERQARLAVDAVFPEPEPGASAVVYTYDDGVYGDEVPLAYEAALAAKQVPFVRVPYDGGSTVFPPAADAAFLSIPLRPAAGWFRAAAAAGFSPPLGVTGIGVLHDEVLLPDLPAGTRLLSPYRVTTSAEARTLRARTGGGMGQSAIHGWITAKALAVALWRSRATTPAQVTAALHGLRGFDTGFFPPYETRGDTTSRTPDGLLYEVVVEDGRRSFAARSGFRATD